MIVYRHSFVVRQDLSLAFRYFLSKEHLVRSIRRDGMELVSLISASRGDLIREGETLTYTVRDERQHIEIILSDVRVQPQKEIRMKYGIGKIESYERRPDEEAEEIKSFLRGEVWYITSFEDRMDGVKITQKVSIKKGNALSLMIYALVYVREKWKDKRNRQEIIDEIEALT